MDNAYIYTRVSTILQVDGYSLDAQEEEIRAFAKQRNINIVGKYSDEGKSGKNAEHRPAFNQMMEDIRSRKDNVKYVLVFKLSRFARNTSDTAKYLQELASYGVGLLGVKDGMDTSTVTGTSTLPASVSTVSVTAHPAMSDASGHPFASGLNW